MRVSRTQLRRIIREERRNLLNELGLRTFKREPFMCGGTPLGESEDDLDEAECSEADEEVDESLRRRVRRGLREVEYAMDRDPVGRFETELANAWDSAVGQGAMESELAMAIEYYLERRGF